MLAASPRLSVRAPAGRALVAALGLLAVVRIVIAAHTPIIDDEGYYWNWSRHLSLSYLDHPPLVAWLDALATAAGRSEWALRLPAMAATLGTTLMLYLFGRDLFGEPAGIRTAVVHLALPVFSLQAIHAIPDPLLYVCWSAGLWTFWRAVHGASGMWWACGLALGLGLLSKYAMVLLPVAWLGVLAWPRYRRLWRTPGPYLAAGVAAVLAAPVVVWNAQHRWASFWFWLRAGQPGGPPLGGSHGWGLVSDLAVQFAYAGPLLFPMLLWALWKSWRIGRGDERFAYLAWAGGPTLLLVAVVNLLGVNRPNWPAPAYLAGALALGALWPSRLGRAAVAFGLALSLAAAALIPLIPSLPPALRWNELYGWREVTEEMVRRAGAVAFDDPGHTVLIGQRYNEASYFGYYAGDRFPVTTRGLSEFSFFAPPHRFAGWQGIAAVDSHENLDRLRRDCARLAEQPPYELPFSGGGVRTFRIFHCEGYRGTVPAP